VGYPEDILWVTNQNNPIQRTGGILVAAVSYRMDILWITNQNKGSGVLW
jgi:hypothetical protein